MTSVRQNNIFLSNSYVTSAYNNKTLLFQSFTYIITSIVTMCTVSW